MLTKETSERLSKVANNVIMATVDVPEELFISLIATIVDTWADMHNCTSDEVIGWYKSIIELKPEVDRQMREKE